MSGNATGNEPDKETALPARGEGTEAQADGAVESRAQVTTAPGDEEAREKSQDEKDQRAMELGASGTIIDEHAWSRMSEEERDIYNHALYLDSEEQQAMNWEERMATLQHVELTGQPAENFGVEAVKTAIKSLKKPCRMCKARKIEKPAAPACGHVFCAKCLIEEARQSAECPVCENMCTVKGIRVLDVKMAFWERMV